VIPVTAPHEYFLYPKEVTQGGIMFADMTILGVTLSIFWFTFLLIVWVALALLPATIAKNKGHSFLGWFILSLFFWWITLFVALLMKDRRHPSAAPTV
jgi:hypothetical protein